MVNLKQELDVLDYFGPLAVWITFFSAVFIISVTFILWCCVSAKDDTTVFSKAMGTRSSSTPPATRAPGPEGGLRIRSFKNQRNTPNPKNAADGLAYFHFLQ